MWSAHKFLKTPPLQICPLVFPLLAAGYLSKSPHVRPYLPNFEAMLLQKRAPVARRHAGPDCPARNCYNVVEQRLEQRPLF